MEVIKNIFINYWLLIVAAIIFILSFILQLFKKKPINSILDDIYKFAILAINETELYSMVDPNVKGESKLVMAVEYVLKWLQALYPDLNVNQYAGYVKDIIESILTTPQKKVK